VLQTQVLRRAKAEFPRKLGGLWGDALTAGLRDSRRLGGRSVEWLLV
jgi:hypothetical protein